jgi:hypothetical protein
MRAAPELLGVQTIGGGSARPGGGGGGSPRSQVSLPPARNILKQRKKTGGFTHFLAYKSLKTLFFIQKYLTRYIPETFLRNTSILKLFIT